MMYGQLEPSHYLKPLELFEEKKLVTVCAPMVRYSKLPFRRLVRLYDCDLCFTPMIISDSFIRSNEARNSEFTYCSDDRPLIVQFASSNAYDLRAASQLVYRYADGVDLNCGCPQRWAMQEGYGACLIRKPELIADMVKQTRNTIPDRTFTVSVKIRIHSDRRNVDLAQQAESAGVNFITVHGRTVTQRSEPVNLEAIDDIASSVRLPVIANGDIKSLEDCDRVRLNTRAKGVMSARGLLANPSLYSGTESTPLSCVRNWVRISGEIGLPFVTFHHHLIYMMEKITCRADKRYLNSISSFPGVIDFLKEKYMIDFNEDFT